MGGGGSVGRVETARGVRAASPGAGPRRRASIRSRRSRAARARAGRAAGWRRVPARASCAPPPPAARLGTCRSPREGRRSANRPSPPAPRRAPWAWPTAGATAGASRRSTRRGSARRAPAPAPARCRRFPTRVRGWTWVAKRWLSATSSQARGAPTASTSFHRLPRRAWRGGRGAGVTWPAAARQPAAATVATRGGTGGGRCAPPPPSPP